MAGDTIDNSSKESGFFRALRVSQIDALQLDEELLDVFRDGLHAVIQRVKPVSLAEYEPELNAVLQFLIWKTSIDTFDATFGQRMLNLRLVHSEGEAISGAGLTKCRRRMYGLACIGCNWMADRLPDWRFRTRSWTNHKKVWLFFDYTCELLKLSSLLNFLAFLQSGHFVTLLERLLSIRSVHTHQQLVRTQGYQYLTRELMWHGFTDFLLFVMPLIDYERLRHRLKLLLLPLPDPHPRPRSREDFLTCGFCARAPVLPHQFSCAHVFCYYCLQIHIDEETFVCPRCGYRTNDVTYRIQSVNL